MRIKNRSEQEIDKTLLSLKLFAFLLLIYIAAMKISGDAI